MTATFLHGLELGFALGAGVVTLAIAPRLRVLHFPGLVIRRRKAGSR